MQFNQTNQNAGDVNNSGVPIAPNRFIDIVFDGPPSHESGRFVEVENPEGASINAGEWIDRGNGLWALRIQEHPKRIAEILSHLWLFTIRDCPVLPQELEDRLAIALKEAGIGLCERPMTQAEVQEAIDSAEEIPLSDEQIQKMVDYAVGKTEVLPSGRTLPSELRFEYRIHGCFWRASSVANDGSTWMIAVNSDGQFESSLTDAPGDQGATVCFDTLAEAKDSCRAVDLDMLFKAKKDFEFIVETPNGYVASIDISAGVTEYTSDPKMARIFRGQGWLDVWEGSEGKKIVPVTKESETTMSETPKMPCEITLAQLLEDYDWAEVFGDKSSGNTDKTTDACPPGAAIDTTPPSRTDVAEIIAAMNGENDGPEWVGIFRLKDGRFLLATGSCDYTGWDCRAGNHLEIAATLEDILQYGLDVEQKKRLGIAS